MSTIDNKIIPNQLNIIINTNVPGYQKIEYKPYMTIPDISKDDKKIIFNPLVKLNKSYVDKVPENLRKKQFFNKGLFDSLVNFTNGIKAESLLQATRNGFVDNNITITLDSIFPENSVLYINKNPYTIADVQFSKGDWKIDTKIKKSQLDSSKITDPALYQTVVKDEIISGENQLQTLPPAIVYGASYKGPKNDINKAKPSPTASGIVPPPLPTRRSSTSTSLTIKNDEHVYKEPIKLITNSDSDDESSSQSTSQSSKNFSNVIEPKTKMLISTRTTVVLRNFFKDERFFTLINTIYSASSENTKMAIQTSLTEYLTIESTGINELNKQSYLKNVLDIKTIRNIGQGNCFFIAVADAINYHNYYNQKNRIISGRYGTGVNLYTQIYLRSLVVKYLESWAELDRYLLNIAPVNADDLNDLFSQQLNGIETALKASGSSDEIAADAYVRIANDIFNSRDNFLVKNVERVPIEITDYYRPFKVLEKGQIQRYILSSNFWANEIVINALCVELQLNVIPFETIKTPSGKLTLRIPYANFSPILNNWNKYLFLYYNQGHYELITFNQKTNPQKIVSAGRMLTKKIKKSKIIFDRNDNVSEIPPIYILFIIYGSYFSSIVSRQEKETFTFKKEIMLTIQNIINNTLYNRPDYNTNFYPLFKLYFPNSYIQENPTQPSKKVNVKLPTTTSSIVPYKSSRGDSQDPDYHGGAYPRYNPYYRPTYYNPQYMAYNMEKRDRDEDSQLAYVITIDMELRPGTSLSPAELTNAKCNGKWNSIRKSYADLVGKPYVIPPLYINKEETTKIQNPRTLPQNNTRKYYKGGNHNKTVKAY
jgi:hypothetical protein